MRFLTAALLALTLTPALAQEPVTLERIMADPDWIGNKPENAYWDDSSQAVYYVQKRVGERIRDPYRLTLIDARAEPVAPGLPGSSNASRRYNADRSAVVWTEDGDVFWRALPGGAVTQLTRSAARERDAQFVLGRNAVSYRNGAGYVVHDLATGAVQQLADLKFEDDPDEEETFDALRENQRRLYETVVEDKRRADALDDYRESRSKESDAAAPLPLYLGKKLEEAGMALSPDARHLLVVTRPKDFKRGKRGVHSRGAVIQLGRQRDVKARGAQRLGDPKPDPLLPASDKRKRRHALGGLRPQQAANRAAGSRLAAAVRADNDIEAFAEQIISAAEFESRLLEAGHAAHLEASQLHDTASFCSR